MSEIVYLRDFFPMTAMIAMKEKETTFFTLIKSLEEHEMTTFITTSEIKPEYILAYSNDCTDKYDTKEGHTNIT